MKKGRRRFSREFKLEAVRQLTSGRQLAQVARELGVDAQVIRRWKDQVTVDAETAFPGNGRVRTEDAEVQRLRQEVTQLRAERDFEKKCGGVLRAGRSVKYHAIQTTECPLSIARRCALLGVSRSGYYSWTTRAPSARARQNGRIVAAMRVIHAEVDRTYGSPRMCGELTARGPPCGRHRAARHMAAAGIRA